MKLSVDERKKLLTELSGGLTALEATQQIDEVFGDKLSALERSYFQTFSVRHISEQKSLAKRLAVQGDRFQEEFGG